MIGAQPRSFRPIDRFTLARSPSVAQFRLLCCNPVTPGRGKGDKRHTDAPNNDLYNTRIRLVDYLAWLIAEAAQEGAADGAKGHVVARPQQDACPLTGLTASVFQPGLRVGADGLCTESLRV